MKIGIAGTGNMGRALGMHWAENGHEVFFGDRDLSKAKNAASLAKGRAEAGDIDSAAAFGSVVLYTVREASPRALLRHPESLPEESSLTATTARYLPTFDFLLPFLLSRRS